MKTKTISLKTLTPNRPGFLTQLINPGLIIQKRPIKVDFSGYPLLKAIINPDHDKLTREEGFKRLLSIRPSMLESSVIKHLTSEMVNLSKSPGGTNFFYIHNEVSYGFEEISHIYL